MTPKEFIAKVILWAYIKVQGLHVILGGVGHVSHCCGLSPWDPPRGPWEAVCSPRICPEYDDCLELFGEDLDLEEGG